MNGVWEPEKRNHSPDSNNLKGEAVWCACPAKNIATVLVVAPGKAVCHTRLVLPNHFMQNGSIMYCQRVSLHGAHSFDKPTSTGSNRSTSCVYCDAVFACEGSRRDRGRGGFNTSSFVQRRNEFCQLSLSPGYWWKLAPAKYSLSVIDVTASAVPLKGNKEFRATQINRDRVGGILCIWLEVWLKGLMVAQIRHNEALMIYCVREKRQVRLWQWIQRKLEIVCMFARTGKRGM